MENVVAYSMINKGENSMNDLNCKKCDKLTTGHDDDVVAVTCSLCSMLGVVELLVDMDTGIVGEA
jgi:hypothetical protein